MDLSYRMYNIPDEIAQHYESWCIRDTKSDDYDDKDLECLSLMIALRDIGFAWDEVKDYLILDLAAEPNTKQKERILRSKRECILDEIHIRQKHLDTLDYLRHELGNTKGIMKP